MKIKTHIIRIAVMAAAILVTIACHTEQIGAPKSRESGISAKIVNTSEASAGGELLVKLRPDALPEAMAEVIAMYGGLCSPAFPTLPGRTAAMKKHGLDRWHIIRFGEEADTEAASRSLAALPEVEAVEYNKLLESPGTEEAAEASGIEAGTKAALRENLLDAGTNDPLFKYQWNLLNNGNKTAFGSAAVEGADVNVVDAWRLSAGDPSIVVAIIDDAVKHTHPDLAANMWTNKAEAEGLPGVDDDANGYVDDIHGYNFVGKGAINWEVAGGDHPGHGTHVAGLVAAVNNNGIGISSVAGGSGKGDGVRLMGCQVFQGGQNGTVYDLAAAIKYAADNGASVLQCSIGSFATNARIYDDAQYERGAATQIELAAFEYFLEPGGDRNINSGVLTDGNMVVISAGNDASTYVSYPGAYRKFICVAAISQDNLPAWYTNYGYGVNICAPGGDNNIGVTILSTLPSEVAGKDYGYIHGTSQATPQVSGIVALGLSYAKKLGRKYTLAEFTSMVLAATDDIDGRLTGTKSSGNRTMTLDSYKGKMGTGSINAWKLMMQIEGTPCRMVKTGSESSVELGSWFGGGFRTLTYTGVTVTDEDRAALGLQGTPEVSEGGIKLLCTKAGSGKITVNAIGGGDRLGGEQTGGMPISRTISIISRPSVSGNGGWL